MNKKLRTIVKLAVVAAIYVALTISLYPLSYGAIQFRLSEFLMILVCYNPLYSISLTVGCLLANIASPMGLIDIIFGTLATLLSCIPMIFIKKNKYLASLIPSIVNAIVIGLELQFAYQVPFYIGAIEVFAGEFVVVSLIGVPVFKAIEKNERVVEALELNVSKSSKLDNFLNSHVLLSFASFIISILLYIRLGLYYKDLGDGSYNIYSLAYYTFDSNEHNNYPFILSLVLLPFLTFLSSLLLKRKLSFILNIVFNSISIIVLIISIIVVKHLVVGQIDFRFYFYFLYFIIVILLEIFSFIKSNRDNLLLNQEKSEMYKEI